MSSLKASNFIVCLSYRASGHFVLVQTEIRQENRMLLTGISRRPILFRVGEVVYGEVNK